MSEYFLKKKFFGQHFLKDKNTVIKLINFIAPCYTDNIIEIGPGDGALTTKLLPLVNKLHVVELDTDLIPILKKNCNFSEKLIIHNKDILKIDFSQFNFPLRIVGNLPYNISTKLLFYLLNNIKLIKDMHLMFQKEVASRISAIPGNKIYGRLSVMTQYFCNSKLLLNIEAQKFTPIPKVSSSFIRMIPTNKYTMLNCDMKKLDIIVKTAFTHRRKTIANSLKNYIPITAFKNVGINEYFRPEQLKIIDFILLSNLLA